MLTYTGGPFVVNLATRVEQTGQRMRIRYGTGRCTSARLVIDPDVMFANVMFYDLVTVIPIDAVESNVHDVWVER